ncbi:MAG: SLC13 family permease [Sphingobium sp.]
MQNDFNAITVTVIFVAGLVGFATGRVRHDLVALIMLLVSVCVGLVRPDKAFSGFGDAVVITVASVMVLSAAISRSGVLMRALKPLRGIMTTEAGIAIVFAVLCGLASAFMNNVGALALLLPAALAACRTAQVSPSKILMPMAFASLLGGLVTLIGTPPNIIIAELRMHYGKPAFAMFDFAAVGIPLALAGTILAVILARLLPERISTKGEPLLFKVADYLFEVVVGPASRSESLTVEALSNVGKGEDRLSVLAIDRGGILLAAPGPQRDLLAGDIVQIEGRAPIVEAAMDRFGLTLASDTDDDLLEAAFLECVVSDGSSLPRMPDARKELSIAGAALVAVSRRGRSITGALAHFRILAGDILLLQVTTERRVEITNRFALMPLAERSLTLGAGGLDWIPVGALILAIVATSIGLTSLSVALVMAVAVIGLMGKLPGNAYRDIDWSILVLLAALIPVAQAFSDSGAGEHVANVLSAVGHGQPGWVLVAATMAATMAVTPFLNNAAAVLIMAPIAANIGIQGHASVDAMLMAVAIGASCDFLTPIGHQSNTLVWGPGGYRFSDYARIGAPLTLLVLVLGTALIDHIWG